MEQDLLSFTCHSVPTLNHKDLMRTIVHNLDTA